MSALLAIENLTVWRGTAPVLHDVTFSLAAGERVALLGDNGAGKSSLLLALAGHLRSAGAICFDGREIGQSPAHRRARSGIGFCPEGRRVFPGMTVAENLLVAGRGPATDRMELLYRLFPELERRQESEAWRLSGGEQQMLALGRALMGDPRLLLLDEPFLGLAPGVCDRLAEALQAISQSGVAMLLADQDRERAQSLCDRSIFLERGRLRL